jgi:rhamnosyltransferase
MLVAGIVTYNPDVGRLTENLEAIAPQVDRIVIVDNGSDNWPAVTKVVARYPVQIIRNEGNLGVAAALNQIASEARELGAAWLLTLDQDSVCDAGLVSAYEKHVGEERVASMTCRITDRSFSYEEVSNEFVDSCITSGNYIDLSEWERLGGFDERLFIDKVDTDYCYRLRGDGKRILNVHTSGILHEVGTGTAEHSLLGKKFVVFNHSAFRVYYLVRNQVYFARKHRQTLGSAGYHRNVRTAWTRIFVYLLYEGDKVAKVKQWARGLHDGYTMSINSSEGR